MENRPKNRWFDLIDLWQHNVSMADMVPEVSHYSAVRQGYWVDSESSLFTSLVLRGCTPQAPVRDQAPKLSQAIGSHPSNTLIGGRMERSPWGNQYYLGD